MNNTMYCTNCQTAVRPEAKLAYHEPGEEREYQDYCPLCGSSDGLAPYECPKCNAEGSPQYPIVMYQDELICLGCYIKQKEILTGYKYLPDLIRVVARKVFGIKDDDIDTAIEIMNENNE